MKFSNADFQLMRWSIAAISSSVILSSTILYSSQIYADHTKKNLRTAQSQMNDARRRLTAAQQDQENMAAYSRDYSILEERNIIGDEHRLDWMEGLDNLRRQNLALDFSYSIAPQKIYMPQPAIDSGNYDIHYSEMKLKLELLHEGQLWNFISALHKQIRGQYQIESCSMQRAPNTSSGNKLGDVDDEYDVAPIITTNIKAECNGGWITLRNRNSQP